MGDFSSLGSVLWVLIGALTLLVGWQVCASKYSYRFSLGGLDPVCSNAGKEAQLNNSGSSSTGSKSETFCRFVWRFVCDSHPQGVLMRNFTDLLPAPPHLIHKWNVPYLPLCPATERHHTLSSTDFLYVSEVTYFESRGTENLNSRSVWLWVGGWVGLSG